MGSRRSIAWVERSIEMSIILQVVLAIMAFLTIWATLTLLCACVLSSRGSRFEDRRWRER